MPQLADRLLDALGATSTLIVPIGALEVWAWGSGAEGPLDPLGTQAAGVLPRAVHVAAGEPGRGLGGFRRTHRQAVHAARADHLLGAEHRRPAVFADLALVSLLSADLPQAREFVQAELGVLAAPDEAMRDLRETLLGYLESQRSPQGAALRLFVSRNTVTYRVNRAETLLGHPISERETELRAALRLARIPTLLEPGAATT